MVVLVLVVEGEGEERRDCVVVGRGGNKVRYDIEVVVVVL